MKKLSHFLTVTSGAFIGAFFGTGIYRIYDYQTNPNLYALQSVPWYSSILVNGVFTLIIVSMLLIIRHFAKKDSFLLAYFKLFLLKTEKSPFF